jgi:hydroxypyruvate reductase 1
MQIPSITEDIFLLQEAILINCSRGPVIDEVALVDHLKENPMFRVGLDVFEVI